jgi:branched-chain amino acid transport system permease protein
MITLALAQMVFFFACRRRSPAARTASRRAARQAVRLIDLCRTTIAMYYLRAGIFLLGFLLIYRIIHSPFGQVLKAIRENEPRAISLGYDTDRYKLLAFVLSARWRAWPAHQGLVFQLASLTDVHWTCRARWC